MPRSIRLRSAATAAGVLLAATTLAACGSGTSPGGQKDNGGADVTAKPTPANAHPAGTVVRVRITGTSVSPDGVQVPVSKGKPVTFLITASAAGELHVHSSPEQHIEYPKGTSAVSLTFANPGIIEVESHALDKLIVQLEVR